MMDYLQMLTAREQLMEDIDCAVEAELDGIVSQNLINAITNRLCSLVCNNFPSK